MLNKNQNGFLFLASAVLLFSVELPAQTQSLQDIARASDLPAKVMIYTAKKIITLDEKHPSATAIAIVGDRILAAGSLGQLKKQLGDQPFSVDDRFAGKTIVPGFIAQHDHPLLTGLTMSSEIIAIEDWVLPDKTVPAAKNREDYLRRLTSAESRLSSPDEPLLTWGFHHYFFGKLTRADLDKISQVRPIIVWHRSCHEFILNTAAMNTLGIDRDFISQLSESARKQSNFDEGHFWEQGMFAIVGRIAPVIASPEKLQGGLEFVVDYFHAKGITLGCEPGGLLSKPLQDAQNSVFSNSDTPFRFYFIPDGKSLVASYPDTTIQETENLMDWGRGMTAMVPRQVKLFADGAIYSQLMQLKDGYLDGHKGEWMMELDVFAKAFQLYWDADYQIHIHVNGDAGLEMVLNNLEKNMRRKPRHDHRTVIVHFAVSDKNQVDRIAKLGAIVSANPYYPVALADRYGESGVGPERADPMTRLGDVERAGISYSFHSDMPMAPADPLFLMHCAVNRKTFSGRVAAPDQRVSRLGALKAITLDAAYSLQMEKQVGSIEPGKLANLTILVDDPVTCDQTQIKDIAVWGTVHEGRIFPVMELEKRSALRKQSRKAMELERVRTMNGMELRRLRSKSKSAFFGSKITAPNSPSTPAGQVAVSCVCGSPFLHILSQNLQSRPVESERR
jgi:predicted amidohydrolase YtcJ